MDTIPSKGSVLREPQARVRAVDITNIFIGAFNVYRSHFVGLALVYLTIHSPAMLFSARFAGRYLELMERLSGIQPLTTGEIPPLFTEEEIAVFLFSLALLLAYFLVIYPILFITPARLAGCLYLGKDVGVPECLRFALGKWWVTQVSYFIFGLLMIGAFTVPLITVYLAFIPGLEIPAILLSSFFFLLAIIVTVMLVFLIVPLNGVIAFEEPKGKGLFAQGISCVRRSQKLAFSRFWYLIGVLILTWILMSLASYVFTAPIDFLVMLVGYMLSGEKLGVELLFLPQEALPAWTLASMQVVNLLVSTLILPFEQIVLGLLYFDLRGKKEGIDLLASASMLAGKDPVTAISNPSE